MQQQILDEVALVERLQEARSSMLEEIGKVIMGQREAIDLLLISLLCRGHALAIGLPGLGKTLMARTLAKILEMDFQRIQFTPDLMPSDITGTDVIEEDKETRHRQLKFLPGPIFSNFILADEINRTPPKTQAALLQAMQETEVTIGRTTYPLTPPFIVVATQNPIELEGTYPLPEAQLDRFMFSIKIFYPSPQEEFDIVRSTTTNVIPEINSILKAEEVLALQELVRGTPVADDVIHYAVRLATATRPSEKLPWALDEVRKYVTYGASPRASQYLILGAKARAILSGRYHVNFEDVQSVALPVLRHRLVLNFRSRADHVDTDKIINHILTSVPREMQ
jgi:MoxR-like ATPase